MTDRVDDRLPPWLELTIPGDRAEGIWRGVTTSRQGRPQALVAVAEGLRAVALTSSLARRVAGFRAGQPVRVTYRGMGRSQAGREYRQLEITPLIEDELPDLPAAAPPTREPTPPRGQVAMPW